MVNRQPGSVAYGEIATLEAMLTMVPPPRVTKPGAAA